MSDECYSVPDSPALSKIMSMAGRVHDPGGIKTVQGDSDPFMVVADGFRVENMASFCPPQRIKRSVQLLEAESFCAYVNRFKNADTLIFCDMTENGCSFTAMIDYHGAAPECKPRYCQHQAIYIAVMTPEWGTLVENSGENMNQVDFAAFLEDNQKLFINPSGADLLELVKTLHGHRNARWNTSLRLDNGSYSVSYDEDIIVKGQQSTKAGEMTLPDKIALGVKVFLGGDRWEVQARLKTRCEDRRLSIWYQLMNTPEVLRENMLALVRKIHAQTEILPLLGRP
jgi:uncharacterized protein YfdQ (DUF2303 family)